MSKSIKKIFIWIASIIGIGILIYIGFVIYVFISFTCGCGFDDGPFIAKNISPIKITKESERFILSNGGELILTNRNNNLSPILTFIENRKIKWTLDTDISKTKGYENCKLWKLSELKIDEDWSDINLTFYGNWTYGSEAGSMEIDREDGENSFCLSW